MMTDIAAGTDSQSRLSAERFAGRARKAAVGRPNAGWTQNMSGAGIREAGVATSREAVPGRV